MKLIGRISSLLLLVSAVVLYSSCDNDDGDKDSQEKTQLAALSGTWNISSVTLDAADRTSDFSNFKLNLSGSYQQDGGTYAYTVTGSRPNPSPWPTEGTWKFGTPVTSQMIRLNDMMNMTYTVTGTQLTIQFNCANCDFSGGRVGVVNGVWNFVFTK